MDQLQSRLPFLNPSQVEEVFKSLLNKGLEVSDDVLNELEAVAFTKPSFRVIFNTIAQMEGKTGGAEEDTVMKDAFVSGKRTEKRETRPVTSEESGDLFTRFQRYSFSYKSKDELRGERVPEPVFEEKNEFGPTVAQGLTAAHNPALRVEVVQQRGLENYDHWNIDKSHAAMTAELAQATERFAQLLKGETIDKFGEPGSTLVVGRVRAVSEEASETFELVNTTDEGSAS
jgi:hypothetical protein